MRQHKGHGTEHKKLPFDASLETFNIYKRQKKDPDVLHGMSHRRDKTRNTKQNGHTQKAKGSHVRVSKKEKKRETDKRKKKKENGQKERW